jgi:hypothetical protein
MVRPHTLRKNKVKRIKASALHTRASRPSQHTHKLCVLVIDIGTFCDFRMMDNAIKDLRHKHTLVYITNKEHKLPDTDIRILYRTPQVLLDHPGDISTNLSGNTVTQLIHYSSTRCRDINSITFNSNTTASENHCNIQTNTYFSTLWKHSAYYRIGMLPRYTY